MRKRNRKKHFSLIFVPDQDQDLKSVSMTYGRGRLLLVIIVILAFHIFSGAVGYFRIIGLEKLRISLQDENKDLKAQNKKIEEIAREFHQLQLISGKIRKAFTDPLGLGNNNVDLNDLRTQAAARNYSSESLRSGASIIDRSGSRSQNGLTFLENKGGYYFDPPHWPTQLPVDGYLTTHFQEGGWFVGRSHLGIDLAARQGTVIKAAGSGYILLADWTPDFGNVVIISHGEGISSYYAHALRLMVVQGQRVRRGQPIALLGSSGISSAPHLHFEIWKSGKPFDPEKIVYALPRSRPGGE